MARVLSPSRADVTALEQNFGISLSMDEMIEIRSVQDIANILDRHGVA